MASNPSMRGSLTDAGKKIMNFQESNGFQHKQKLESLDVKNRPRKQGRMFGLNLN